MDQDDLDKETQDTLIRLLKHLPQPKSNMRVEILIAHIAVEELAWKLLVKKLPNPAVIARASLTTHQLICLLESLDAREPIEWLWKATKKLNAIRNDLAHELEPKGFDDKVHDFIKFIEDNTGTPGRYDLKELGPLRCAILSLHAAFYVLVEDTRSASPSNP